MKNLYQLFLEVILRWRLRVALLVLHGLQSVLEEVRLVFIELRRAGVDRELFLVRRQGGEVELLLWFCWWWWGSINLLSIGIILYAESLRSFHWWLAILVVGVVREVPTSSTSNTILTPVVLG